MSDDVVTVASYPDGPTAHAARSRLASAGIRAVVFDEHAVTMDPTLRYALGGVRVAVAGRDEAQARRILGVPARTRVPPCPACGLEKTRVRNPWLFLIRYAFTLGHTLPRYGCRACGHRWKGRWADTTRYDPDQEHESDDEDRSARLASVRGKRKKRFRRLRKRP